MDTGALFDAFINANTFRNIQHSFLQLCTSLDIDPCDSANVYKQLRCLQDWKAAKLWKLLDKQMEKVEYRKQRAADRLAVLVIGAGPCGLRSAIECALLGSRVVVIEQRDRFSRNNVLHLWEFVIHDIKSLGAKIFYPKFCTGSIEHISIRQLQCILLKVALCLGVQVHEGVSFTELIFPKDHPDGTVSGFRAALTPEGHILSNYEFDVLIGADGKRNTVPGFTRDEMRGKLAIAITANFVNNRTAAEERVPEISGVAYIFNQAFFKEMYATTGVDLENIVYYKDDTHYFVMCAKKHSLLDMGVIKTDFDDATRLLAPDNVDREALCNYARAAADFATHGKLPALDFAKNHRSQEDIAMFDFTSLYSSRCSVRLIERRDKRLLMGIVGDSLHEPFWPTGSGCARGFLGVFDTAWLIREYGLNQRGTLEMIADRESVYKLLAQVTKDNMHKSLQKYTIDPRTRYVSPDFNLDPADVANLINSDHPRTLTTNFPMPLNSTESAHTRDLKQRLSYALWRFCNQVLAAYKLKLYDLDICWRDGKALSAVLAKFLSDKVAYFKLLAVADAVDRLREVFTVIEAELGIQPPCAPEEWEKLSKRGKQAFIGDIVVCIRNDPDRLRRSVITPKANTQKRKIQKPIQASRRKTQPIEKLAQDLLGCSTFRNGEEDTPSKISKNDVDDAERHAKRLERLSNEGDENANKPTPAYRYKTTTEQKEDDAKTYTKRPQVDRLDPTLVGKVERIVTGDLVKDMEKQMYAEKDKEAAKRAGKMDRSSLQAMERKLMEAGMAQSHHKAENMTSQEEKIMRAVATDARREAENGFTKAAETGRFKQYDETIKKSEEALRKRDIAGIDPFNRRKEQQPPSQAPPPVPPKPIENQENSMIFRPTAPVLPKRHSVPVLESCYESVNARKQNNCQLCNKVVYLAERMQVESMYIHKNCFRCAYCSQPLRLGEYGKDKDLEFHYPTKFFCNIHLRVPLREKIARIERANRLGRGNSKETAAVPPLPVTKPPQEGVVVERRATLSFFSPEQLRESTMERMQRSVVSPVAELTHFSEVHTPERAEFGSHTKVKEAIPVDEKKEVTRVPSGSESEEEEEEPVATALSPESSDKTEEDEDSLSDSESLEEDEIAELETTVLQLADENPDQPITEEQVLSVIDKLNKRRANASFAPDELPMTPEKQHPEEVKEEFFTPAVTFRTPERAPPTRERARTIAALPTEDDLAEFKTPCMDDIRKQKSEELARLRNESRARAASKTDAELGIGEQKRFSVQLDIPTTPVTSRAHTDSPPRDRTKPRSSSLLNEMPSMRRDSREDRLEVHTEERSPRPGMLSKLFSPDLMRKKAPSPTSAMVNAHCDSRRETNILSNAFRRLKLKHRTETSPRESPVVSRVEPRVAAVAPSPRIVTDSVDSPSTSQIPINERSLKSFAKKAEKIIRQRDEALPRTAQEIQRSIQQNEIRLEEIRQIGEQHEKKLTMDPLNKWELECWMALVREKEALQDAIEASKRRLRKLELQVRYRDLNARFRQHDADEMPDQNLLTEMLTIVQEKDRLEKDGDMKFKKILNIEEILGCKKYDFRNFEPVFSSERP